MRFVVILSVVYFAAAMRVRSFGQMTDEPQQLFTLKPLTAQSPDFTLVMNVLKNEKDAVAKMIVIQKKNRHTVLLESAWNGDPLLYVHEGQILFVSASHPGKIEMITDERLDLSLIPRDGGTYFGLDSASATTGPEPIANVDFGGILNGCMPSKVSSIHDLADCSCTVHTKHSLLTVQKLAATANFGEISFLSLSNSQMRLWTIVLTGKQPGISFPLLGIRPTIDGDSDSLLALLSGSDARDLWKNNDFADACHVLEGGLRAKAWVVQSEGMSQIQSLETALLLAKATTTDHFTRGKVDDLFNRRIENVVAQMAGSDVNADEVTKRYDRIFEEGKFATELSKMLPAAEYFEFAKRYLAHPTAMTRCLGFRAHRYNLLCDAEDLKVPAEQKSILAAAVLEDCDELDQLDDRFWRFMVTPAQYKDRNDTLGGALDRAFTSTLSPDTAGKIHEREASRAVIDAFTGLDVQK